MSGDTSSYLRFPLSIENKPSIFQEAHYLFVLLAIPENNSRRRLVSFDPNAKSRGFFDALHYYVSV
jgi:hypothetical protein